jgi:hypothetical protein
VAVEVEPVAPPAPLVVPEVSPVSTVPEHAATSGAATSARPRSAAPAARVRDPSALRSGAPQLGHSMDDERAWREHLGQASSVS